MVYTDVNRFGTGFGNDGAETGLAGAFDPPQGPPTVRVVKFASTFAPLLLRCNAAVFDRIAPSRV